MLFQLCKEIWLTGMFSIFKLTAVIVGFVVVAQLSWMFYRWVTDADTEWPEEKRGNLYFFGKKMTRSLGINFGSEFAAAVGGLAIAMLLFGVLWPLVIFVGTVLSAGFGMRGMIRFKRRVTRALDKKADADHNHDDRYNKKAENGAVNT